MLNEERSADFSSLSIQHSDFSILLSGFFLLHFPSGFPAWTLSSTVALCSSDFPHGTCAADACASETTPARPSGRPLTQERLYVHIARDAAAFFADEC